MEIWTKHRGGRSGVLRFAAGTLALVLWAGAAAAQTFPDLTAIDTKLTRGESKKADVLLVVGEPQGTGGAMIPTDGMAKEVWYYENLRVKFLQLKGRQQVLLVFFRGEVYDGYLWFDVHQDMHFK